MAERVETLIELHRQFAGPLPPPEILAGYEEVLPGAAQRIFALTEGQAKHRQELERTIVVGGAWRSWAGLVAGLIVALAFLIAAYRLIQDGHSLQSLAEWSDSHAAVEVLAAQRIDRKRTCHLVRRSSVAPLQSLVE